MTSPPAATPKKSGCLRRILGCLATAFVLTMASCVALALLPGRQARVIRGSIKPGMSATEVIKAARGWLFCRAYAGPEEKRIRDIEVYPTRLADHLSEAHREFETTEAMAKALAEEMSLSAGPWKMTFGYLTLIPRRIYFDVEFSADGRVSRVSETRWGTLD